MKKNSFQKSTRTLNVLILFFSCLLANVISAQGYATFNGTVDNKWSTAANWTPSNVPVSGDIITIAANCVLDVDATVGRIILGSATTFTTAPAGLTFDVNAGKKLTLVGVAANTLGNTLAFFTMFSVTHNCIFTNNGTVTVDPPAANYPPIATGSSMTAFQIGVAAAAVVGPPAIAATYYPGTIINNGLIDIKGKTTRGISFSASGTTVVSPTSINTLGNYSAGIIKCTTVDGIAISATSASLAYNDIVNLGTMDLISSIGLLTTAACFALNTGYTTFANEGTIKYSNVTPGFSTTCEFQNAGKLIQVGLKAQNFRNIYNNDNGVIGNTLAGFMGNVTFGTGPNYLNPGDSDTTTGVGSLAVTAGYLPAGVATGGSTVPTYASFGKAIMNLDIPNDLPAGYDTVTSNNYPAVNPQDVFKECTLNLNVNPSVTGDTPMQILRVTTGTAQTLTFPTTVIGMPSGFVLDNTTTIGSIYLKKGTLSVDSKQAFEFSVYPNPVREVLNIQTQEKLSRAKVIDILGKVVVDQKNPSTSLNVSSLNKGIYLLELTSEKGATVSKIVKE
jgi:hypothetical protein